MLECLQEGDPLQVRCTEQEIWKHISTTQSVVLTADVFQLFERKHMLVIASHDTVGSTSYHVLVPHITTRNLFVSNPYRAWLCTFSPVPDTYVKIIPALVHALLLLCLKGYLLVRFRPSNNMRSQGNSNNCCIQPGCINTNDIDMLCVFLVCCQRCCARCLRCLWTDVCSSHADISFARAPLVRCPSPFVARC